MSRASYDTITTGLDQLYFSPLVKDETVQDRANCIENFLHANGWSWNDYITSFSKENETWIPKHS